MAMQAYDVFMLTVLVAAIAWGAWKGLAWQVASIASIGLSYFVAVNFRAPVAQLFKYDPPEWNNFLAMLVLYLGSSLVIWVAFNGVRSFIEKVQLKEFDRQVGGLVGAAKGVLICTVVTLFTMGLGTDAQRQAIVSSRSGYYIARLLEQVQPLMPAEYHQRLQQTIAQLEQRHGVAQGTYLDGLQLPFSWRPDTNDSGGWTSGFGSQADPNSGWGQSDQTWNQSGPGSGWVTPENIDRIQRDVDQFQQNVDQFRQVLPRIEQEQARFQSEIDRFGPPRTGR